VLKKGHPFVDVFLPLKTDAGALAVTIEKFVKPTKNPHLASICGLTQSSRLTLSGELQNRLQLLRRQLSETSLDEDKVASALKMFRYFHRYVSTEDVRSVVLQVEGLVESHIKEQIASIQTEIIKGTRSEHDFGHADVASVKSALSILGILQNECPERVDLDCIHNNIKEELVRFQQQLMIGRGRCFDGLHHDLSKMHAWSKGFPEFLPLYEGTTSHLATLIKSCISDAVATKSDQLAGLPFAQLEAHFKNLNVLQSISENAEYLAPHTLDVNGASDVYRAAIDSIRSLADSWGATAQSELQAATRDENRLRSIVRVSTFVEAMLKLLDRFPLCPRLVDEVGRLKQRLATEAADSFEAIVSEMDDVALFERSPSEAQASLRQIRLASKLFSDIGEGWRLLEAVFDGLIERVKSSLIARMGEIDEMSLAAKEQGIRNGRREAQMLTGFKSLVWFDNFLPDDEKFIENSSIKSFREYKDRIALVGREVGSSLKAIADHSIDSGPVAAALQNLLDELGQISIMGDVLQDDTFPPVEEDTRTNLREYVRTLVKGARKDVHEWKEVLLNDSSSIQSSEVITERVEIGLREISALTGLDALCDDMLSTLQSEIGQASSKFSNEIKSTMQSSGNYEEKAKSLRTVIVLGKYTHLARLLPGIGKLKALARNAVAADAQEIQDRVSETSDWDEIDCLLTKFQDAVILDEFTLMKPPRDCGRSCNLGNKSRRRWTIFLRL